MTPFMTLLLMAKEGKVLSEMAESLRDGLVEDEERTELLFSPQEQRRVVANKATTFANVRFML
jgi:hypothetical protein